MIDVASLKIRGKTAAVIESKLWVWLYKIDYLVSLTEFVTLGLRVPTVLALLLQTIIEGWSS